MADIARVLLRIPADLRSQVGVAAKQSGRSVNSEMVMRLRESFVGAGGVEGSSGKPAGQARPARSAGTAENGTPGQGVGLTAPTSDDLAAKFRPDPK